jgi:hypothetical protein
MKKLKTTIEYDQFSLLLSPSRHKCRFLDYELMLTEWSGSLGQGFDDGISKVEAQCEVFAERICQATVYANTHSMASGMKLTLISPLWILQQYFIDKKDQQRSLWCQCALQAIPPRNVGFSSLLTKLSIQEYQALGGDMR